MISAAPLSWSSSDPTIARVSEVGVVTAISTGRAVISVALGDATTSLDLAVTRAGVRNLGLSPRPSAIEVGDRVALSVTGGAGGAGDAGGSGSSGGSGGVADATSRRPRLVAWHSSEPRVATVNATGLVTAHAEGSVQIIARGGGSEAMLQLRVTRAVIALVTVSPPAPRLTIGDRMMLQAEPSNPKGQSLPGYAVRWEVSDPAIAAISSEGVLTALRAGQVLVAARVEGRVGTARVMVAPASR